jgi:DNA helicase-2/ATP-dependent DNA helicase PcrA
MQREAATHTEGPLLIFAGAGSGKTRALTCRAAYLIENGVSPFNIIAITFTNKAAREMRERINDITPRGASVWVATFHSTCVSLLRRGIESLGYNARFSIHDAADSERLVKNCVAELNLDEKLYPARYVANVISTQKNELIGPAEFARQAGADFRMSNIAEVYELYQRRLVASNALDFDDIIFKTVELFESEPDTLARWQERFRYIMVDEYQDTNNAQYRFVRLLADARRNLCVVGDDDQSIYGWRGANIGNILNFERDFPDAKVVRLEQNYRSTKTILSAANAVIRNNRNRAAKTLWTENAQGEKITLHAANSEKHEAQFVADTVKGHVAGGGRYGDCAVLYRNNAQSRAVEDCFVLAGVPYRLYGGVRFYERAEVRDVLAYLKAVNNPADDAAYTRIVNVPRRGLGDASVARVLEYARANGLPFSAALREVDKIGELGARAAAAFTRFADLMEGLADYAYTHSVTGLLQRVLDETAYMASLADGTDEGVSRAENVKELVTKAFEFEAVSEDRALSAFLEDVALVADIDGYEESADFVSLLTLHSAKGLEFRNVFVVGLEEGIFPSMRSVTSADADDLEEERRLCYVGMTRAKERLYLTRALSRMQYGKTVYNTESRFLKEAPREYLADAVFADTQKTSGRAEMTRPSARANTPPRANPYLAEIPKPSGAALDFGVGDRVWQAKYGHGTVLALAGAGADYEVTVAFDLKGEKKLMARLSGLRKASAPSPQATPT